MMRIGFLSSTSATGMSRDFSPVFFRELFRGARATLVLDEAYGSSFDYHYDSCIPEGNLELVSREEVIRSSSSVFSLLAPTLEELELFRKVQTIISFLHYSTHPDRVQTLQACGCRAISIDSIVDGDNNRLVQDFGRVARGAMSAAFAELRKRVPDRWWKSAARGPIVVYIFGAGAVAAEVAKESFRMGNTGLLEELNECGGNPEVEVVMTNSAQQSRQHFSRFADARPFPEGGFPHIVVDAARRTDTSRSLLSEADYGQIPPCGIIVDVSADDYAGAEVVKGFCGVPSGDDKQAIFELDDPAWISAVPRSCRLQTASRRVSLSHYSWCSAGSLDAKRANAKHYAGQLFPILRSVLFPDGDTGESFSGIAEAVSRAELAFFLQQVVKP